MPGMVNTSFILDMQWKFYRWSVVHTLTTRSTGCARRAGCGETRTSGSESGMAKPTPETGQGAPSRLYTEISAPKGADFLFGNPKAFCGRLPNRPVPAIHLTIRRRGAASPHRSFVHRAAFQERQRPGRGTRTKPLSRHWRMFLVS